MYQEGWTIGRRRSRMQVHDGAGRVAATLAPVPSPTRRRGERVASM